MRPPPKRQQQRYQPARQPVVGMARVFIMVAAILGLGGGGRVGGWRSGAGCVRCAGLEEGRSVD